MAARLCKLDFGSISKMATLKIELITVVHTLEGNETKTEWKRIPDTVQKWRWLERAAFWGFANLEPCGTVTMNVPWLEHLLEDLQSFGSIKHLYAGFYEATYEVLEIFMVELSRTISLWCRKWLKTHVLIYKIRKEEKNNTGTQNQKNALKLKFERQGATHL